MSLVLYVIPLSHSALVARLMLEHKDLPYRVVRLLSGLHPIQLRLAGFRGGTVPALRADGERVQGSLSISRFLDTVRPEPALFPTDPGLRREVEEAEAWGANLLQDVPRRLFRWALVRDREMRRSLARLNRLPGPAVASVLLKPIAIYFARTSDASDTTVARHIADLPSLLDHSDALIQQGVIGVEARNAATYQIGPSLRLLMEIEQLRPMFEGRPCSRFASALLPVYPGDVPAVRPRFPER